MIFGGDLEDSWEGFLEFLHGITYLLSNLPTHQLKPPSGDRLGEQHTC